MEEAIKFMKAGKAGGPTEVVGEMLKAAGKKGIKRLTELCNQVVRRRGNSKRMGTQHPHPFLKVKVIQWSVVHTEQ